jgi:hypothetical protein
VSQLTNKRCDDPRAHDVHVWQYVESSDPSAFQAICSGAALPPNVATVSTGPDGSQDVETYGLPDAGIRTGRMIVRDHVLYGPKAGVYAETKRYGYYVPRDLRGRPDPDGPVRAPWVIACDKPGREGPFTVAREVTYGPWVHDAADGHRPDFPRRDEVREIEYVIEARFDEFGDWTIFRGRPRSSFDEPAGALEQAAENRRDFPQHEFRIVKRTTTVVVEPYAPSEGRP